MTRTAVRNFAIILGLLYVSAAATCESDRLKSPPLSTAAVDRIDAANTFSRRYTQSRFSRWNIRANAAGVDCDVLFINTSVPLEESMIEAMQYGAGAYDIVDGGVQRFCRDRTFRGVAYRDSSERVWTYGAVSVAEAERMIPCRKSPP